MIMRKDPAPSTAARCAVALNNVGCHLLERSCYAQAYETFKEALQLVQLRVVAERERPLQALSTGTEATVHQTLYMQEQVHRAQLRLMDPVRSPVVTPYKPLMYSAPSPDVQLVLSQILHNSYYAIRIDVCGADDAQQISDDVLTTILLINFVNAGRTMAEIRDSMAGPSSEQGDGSGRCCGATLGRSVKILELANAFIDQRSDNSESSLFLVLVALDTTVQVHAEAGKATEAAALRSRLEALKVYAETTLGFLFGRAPAAGAA